MEQDKDEFEFDRADLDSLETEANRFMRVRFVLFFVRWTIGFLILWWVTTRWPDLSWLWWPAVIVAAISFILLLLSRRWIGRKLGKTRETIDQAEQSIREIEDDLSDD